MPSTTLHASSSRDFGGTAAIGTAEQRAKPSTERSLNAKCLLALEWTDRGTCAQRILDERDAAIVGERLALMDRVSGPRVGDWIRFADGTERRISHAYHVADGWDENAYQTSDGGRWYLASFGCSFSGSLYPSVGGEFIDTGETRDGSAWFFHHDHRCAHNGVDFVAPFRVFTCTEEAPR
jgi:hypothetical protein